MGSMMGKGGGGGEAAGIQQGFNQQGIDFLKRQIDVVNGRLQPFFRAGQAQIPALTQGATAGGLDERLGEIFDTDTFRNLTDERARAVQGQLSAGGLTRSGTGIQEAARVPTDIGLAIEEMLTGRSRGLASQGQSGILGIGQIGSGLGQAIAQLLSGSGQAGASGALADKQAKAQGTQQMLGTAATVASMFFSDPTLKENAEPIGRLHDLTLYQWDWKPETRGTIIEDCGTVGFMADEVQAKYPHRVKDYCGLLTIDYQGLLAELEALH